MPPTTTFMPLNILVIRGKEEELPVYLSDYQFAPFLCLQNVGPNENEVLKRRDRYCIKFAGDDVLLKANIKKQIISLELKT